jgi:hypothetical protein
MSGDGFDLQLKGRYICVIFVDPKQTNLTPWIWNSCLRISMVVCHNAITIVCGFFNEFDP